MNTVKRKIEDEIKKYEREYRFLDEMHDYNNAILYRGYVEGLKIALKILEEVSE